MKSLLPALFVFCLVTSAQSQDSFTDTPVSDPEQRQLEWCFQYSNLLGYDINYISNPRLYMNISGWLGTPYRYSGNSRSGIDCSGFVAEMYEQCFQKKMNGTAKDMFDASTHLRRSELLEGDLVFFRIKNGRVSHVGIYLGQNKFVHSSTQNGVIISDLSEKYYDKYFYKGGRVGL